MRISMRLGVMLMILLGLAGLVPAPLSVVSAHTEEVELQRRVDEIRREMKNEFDERVAEIRSDYRGDYQEWRDKSIDRWLSVIGLLVTVFAIALPILAALGFKELRELRDRAEKSVEDIKDKAEEADESLEEIKDDMKEADEVVAQIKGNLHRTGSNPFLSQRAPKPAKNLRDTEGADTADASQLEKAIATVTECSKILETEPENVETYYNRGFAKIVLEQYQWAIDDFNQVLTRDSTNAAAYNSRGFAKNMLNQYESAIADFDAALRLRPAYARAYINRGMTKVDRDLAEEAKADWETALKLAAEQGRVDLKRLIEELLKTIQPLLSAEVGGSGR